MRFPPERDNRSVDLYAVESRYDELIDAVAQWLEKQGEVYVVPCRYILGHSTLDLIISKGDVAIFLFRENTRRIRLDVATQTSSLKIERVDQVVGQNSKTHFRVSDNEDRIEILCSALSLIWDGP